MYITPRRIVGACLERASPNRRREPRSPQTHDGHPHTPYHNPNVDSTQDLAELSHCIEVVPNGITLVWNPSSQEPLANPFERCWCLFEVSPAHSRGACSPAAPALLCSGAT